VTWIHGSTEHLPFDYEALDAVSAPAFRVLDRSAALREFYASWRSTGKSLSQPPAPHVSPRRCLSAFGLTRANRSPPTARAMSEDAGLSSLISTAFDQLRGPG
jgi:hypothetical protein